MIIVLPIYIFADGSGNDQTVAFRCIYDIFTINTADLSKNAKSLAELYEVDTDELLTELLMFRTIHAGKAFAHFSDFAKFILLQCSQNEFPLITFFTQIILILPFATADCERSFSAMNRIKSAKRSRLKTILMDLMLLYDITLVEKAKVLTNIWKYKKKDILQ